MKSKENDNASQTSHLTIHNSTISLNKSNFQTSKNIDLQDTKIKSNFTFNNNNQKNHLINNQDYKTIGGGSQRNTTEKKYKNINEKEEIEFPNIRTFSKELMQNIYKKESGEILSILRKGNDTMRSSKIPFPNNQISENSEKYRDELTFKGKDYDEESASGKSMGKSLNNDDSALFQPGMMSFKVKKKANKSKNMNTNEKFGDVSARRDQINKDHLMKDIITRNSSSNHFNANMEDKSLMLTQSSKGGFPKILGKLNQRKNDNSNTDEGNLLISKKKSKSKSPSKDIQSMYKYNETNNNNYANSFQTLNNSQGIYHQSGTNSKYMNLNSSNNSHNLNMLNKTIIRNSNKLFCPHCEHCNSIRDDYLEKYFNMKEAKNIVKKSLDFIVTNYQTDQSYLDFLLGNNNPPLDLKNYTNNHSVMTQINSNNNLNVPNIELENLKNIKQKTKFDIETLLNTYPKHTNNRSVLQIVTHFLDALVDDKVSLDTIAGPETFEKLKDSLISQGIAFKENEAEIEFDKELEVLFDDSTKDKLRKLFKSKILILFRKIYENE